MDSAEDPQDGNLSSSFSAHPSSSGFGLNSVIYGLITVGLIEKCSCREKKKMQDGLKESVLSYPLPYIHTERFKNYCIYI